MYIDLSDKVIVITGASGGIGKKLAERFSDENAKLVLNYNTNYDNAIKIYNNIKSKNKECLLVQADVTNYEDVKKLCKKTIEAYGKIDVLINNAGICSDNLITMLRTSEWNNVINTNLNSVFLCSKVFSKEMIKRGHGKIINIASLKGQLGSEGQTNYSASKAGVIGFTKALAKELGNFNISVNAVCPGYICTDLNKDNDYKKKASKDMSVMDVDKNLVELSDFLIYLSSDKINYVSGRVFNIDSRIK